MSSHKNKKHIKRIGILGGTFDPIHIGHLNPALDIAETFSFDQLTLMPAHIPPHKSHTIVSSEHRVNMVKLASETHSLLSVDARELDRDIPSYTSTTLEQIHNEQPNWQLFFILGMDSLLSFTSWYKWQNILKYCHLIVTVRPEYSLSSLDKKQVTLLTPFFAKNKQELKTTERGLIYFEEQPTVKTSSTELRHAIKNNCLDETKIPQSVIRYIQQNNLYR